MLSGALPGFDVIAVPDFSTPARAAVFEARTLFFLASWLENAGQAKMFPLHLACIGEPPASVRRLASQCGAAVNVCAPLGLTGSLTANKLRGLEIPGKSERVLMLDTDLFILGDFSELAAIVPSGLAAAPAGSKWVPEALWQRIYQHLALPLPRERTPMLRAEYGLLSAAQTRHEEFGRTTDLNQMLPYYNSGVFLAPRDSGLREVWADHLVRLAKLFGPIPVQAAGPDLANGRKSIWAHVARAGADTWKRVTGQRVKYPRSVTTCDQATFSTAIQQLRGLGVPFHRLPDPYHTRRLHCQAGKVRLDDIKIYHATGFLRPGKKERWDLDRALEEGIGQWQTSLRVGGKYRPQAEADEDARKAGDFLRRLYKDHVRPALSANA